MQEFWADLHIHTVLSPCASLEMSPKNIVLTALEKKVQIIGITDHNSTRNCKAVVDFAKPYELYVLSGVEITSKEEVHCLAFFEYEEQLNEFQNFIDGNLPEVENKNGKFGYQAIVDKEDNILQIEERLLITALESGIDEIEQKVYSLNGIFIPAHVDKTVNSIFSQLAFIPSDIKVDALGISSFGNENEIREKHVIDEDLTLLMSSDSHYLKDIGKGKTAFFMINPHFSEIKLAIQHKMGRFTRIE